ncbi:MAG: alpha-amylase family glycosyl hydrolase [Chloroherpetonaceae bacterium]|nr:alpha-amylase family glycosyl hydrolase [Chloroherpetonaceae bacterium]
MKRETGLIFILPVNLLLMLIFHWFVGQRGIAQVKDQSLAPFSTKDGMRFSYKHQGTPVPKRVALAGDFTGWQLYRMKLDSSTGIWSALFKLGAGETHFYKFVLDDTIWVTDPNAPDFTKDDNRNGIFISEEFGKPYVQNIFPPKNYLMKSLRPLSVRLKSDFGIKPNSLSVTLNDKPQAFQLKADTLLLNLKPDLLDGEYFLRVTFQNEKGVSASPFETNFILDRTETQLTTPVFFKNAVMYEVFVRRFHDTNGDGIGDLNGVTQKLDYIRSLGATVLWLMPIHPSPFAHGYSVTNYFDVDPKVGSKADFKTLLDEAHKRGMKVILDYVINHTDSTHEYFQSAYKNPYSPYSKWFQFTETDNANWKHFGGSRYMPKINFFHEPAEDWAIEVAKYWLKFGVDGFRCDAAKEPPHKFWKRLRKELKTINPDVLLLGEIWDNANFIIPYFRDEFDMVYDYPLFYPLIDLVQNGNQTRFKAAIEEIKNSFPTNALLTRFLSNHDNNRPLAVFDNDTAKVKQALTILWTLHGTPMIYYGDEIGMNGKIPPDDNVRQKMKWESVDSLNSILKFYKKLSMLRETYPHFRSEHNKDSSSVQFVKTSSPNVIAYLRRPESSRVGKGARPSFEEQYRWALVIVNVSDKDVEKCEFTFDSGPLSAALQVKEVLSDTPEKPKTKWRGSKYQPFERLKRRDVRVLIFEEPTAKSMPKKP